MIWPIEGANIAQDPDAELLVLGRALNVCGKCRGRPLGINVFCHSEAAQGLQIERKWIDIGLIGEVLSSQMRAASERHKQTIDGAQMMHFLHRYAQNVFR